MIGERTRLACERFDDLASAAGDVRDSGQHTRLRVLCESGPDFRRPQSAPFPDFQSLSFSALSVFERMSTVSSGRFFSLQS